MSFVATIASLAKSSPRLTVEDFAPGASIEAAKRPLEAAEATEARERLREIEKYLAEPELTDLQRSTLTAAATATRLQLRYVMLSEEEAHSLAERLKGLSGMLESEYLEMPERFAILRQIKKGLAALATRRLEDVRQVCPKDGKAAAIALPAAAHLAEMAFKRGVAKAAGKAALAAFYAEEAENAENAEKQELMAV